MGVGLEGDVGGGEDLAEGGGRDQEEVSAIGEEEALKVGGREREAETEEIAAA